MKYKILNLMLIIMLGMIIALGIFTNIRQNENINLLNTKIKCLEQGRVYAFDNYCQNRVINIDN